MCPKGERVRERERWRLLHRRSIRSFIDVYIGTTETESCNVRANCGEGIKGDFLGAQEREKWSWMGGEEPMNNPPWTTA